MDFSPLPTCDCPESVRGHAPECYPCGVARRLREWIDAAPQRQKRAEELAEAYFDVRNRLPDDDERDTMESWCGTFDHARTIAVFRELLDKRTIR